MVQGAQGAAARSRAVTPAALGPSHAFRAFNAPAPSAVAAVHTSSRIGTPGPATTLPSPATSPAQPTLARGQGGGGEGGLGGLASTPVPSSTAKLTWANPTQAG